MPDDLDLAGRVIADRYRVERKLGSGGMGSVWAVQHVESSARYALKTLHRAAAADRMTVERFVREARAAATLSSRHVVKIIDAQRGYVDPESGAPLPFLVMELLDGCNLEQLLGMRGPLTVGELVWVLRQVGRALDGAHQKKIIHRDLKPENLFLAQDEDGAPLVKVCDFGIAKMVGEAGQGLLSTGALGTDDNLILGTPMYMSPEQIRDAGAITAASDQWSVGLIAYKLLVGRDYFGDAKTSGQLVGKILADPIEAPSQRDAKFDARLDAWFLRSCAREPGARFAGVGAQVDALVAALDGEEPRPIDVPKRRIDIESTVTGGDVGVETTVRDPAVPAHTGAPSATTNGKAPSKPRGRRAWWLPVAVVLPVLALGAYAVRGAMRGEAPGSTSTSTDASAPSASSSTVTTSGVPSSGTSTVASASATTEPPATSATSVASAASAAITTSATGPGPAKTKPSLLVPKPTASTGPTKLAKGASCTRASECASGYCFAEQCQ